MLKTPYVLINDYLFTIQYTNCMVVDSRCSFVLTFNFMPMEAIWIWGGLFEKLDKIIRRPWGRCGRIKNSFAFCLWWYFAYVVFFLRTLYSTLVNSWSFPFPARRARCQIGCFQNSVYNHIIYPAISLGSARPFAYNLILTLNCSSLTNKRLAMFCVLLNVNIKNQ